MSSVTSQEKEPQPVRGLWSRLREELHNPHVLALLVAVGVYCSYWSWLSVARYYGMATAVFDLGLFEQHVWIFTQPGSIALFGIPGLPGWVQYLGAVADQPFEFLLSPLGLVNSYPLILVLQSIALGLGAVPLYAIARKVLSLELPALVISLAYLLYFPLAGVNWFDAHFIAFFVPLFLFGFYFLLKRSFRLAGLVLLIAGSTEFPSMLLILLFSLTLLGEAILNGKILRRGWDRPALKFSLALFSISLLFFVFQFVYLGPLIGPQAFAVTVHTATSGGVDITSGPISIENRITVALLIVAPVLFLPLVSPRWLVMLAPIGYAIFGTTYFGYAFPEIFRTQYCAIFIPFIFLGTVYAIHWLRRFDPASGNRTVIRSTRLGRVRRLTRPTTLTLMVLVSVVVFASVFQPYGPLNDVGPNRFVVPSADMTRFNELQRLEALVPRSTPFVLFQNDMPEMLPRPLAYFDTPLVAGIEDWRNFSVADAQAGQFPLTLFSGHTVDATVQYALDNPYNWGFLARGANSNDSMYDFIRDLYESGAYGILGEVDGMMVLQRDYAGAPVLFSPFDQTILARALSIPDLPLGDWNNGSWNGTMVPSGEDVISVVNGDSTHAWDGPGLILSPGEYTIRFKLLTTNLSNENHVTLTVVAGLGSINLGAETIHGSDFTEANVWTNFNLTVYVNNTYQMVNFPGLSVLWHGALSIQSIDISQRSPGSPLYPQSVPST